MAQNSKNKSIASRILYKKLDKNSLIKLVDWSKSLIKFNEPLSFSMSALFARFINLYFGAYVSLFTMYRILSKPSPLT